MIGHGLDCRIAGFCPTRDVVCTCRIAAGSKSQIVRSTPVKVDNYNWEPMEAGNTGKEVEI